MSPQQPITPAPTTVTILYGTSSNVTVTLTAENTYAQFQRNVQREGGYWNGATFIPIGQITGMTAQ